MSATVSLSLPELARALDGVVVGGQVAAPGPGHSRRDRSLVVALAETAPEGILVHSHAGDDWRACRDHVLDRLGIEHRREDRHRPDPVQLMQARLARQQEHEAERAAKGRRAAAVWEAACDPRGTLVETYLAGRGLALPDEVAGVALRFHPRCPWRDDGMGEVLHVPAMVAILRDLRSNAITGLHRTRLDAAGCKRGRKMSGAAAGSAVKLDADEAVTTALVVGEGIETVLSARQLGLRPAWALASAGAIGTLPVLGGIEALTLLAETDATGANAAAIEACRVRWHEAGRHIAIATPNTPGDFNDIVMGGARDA